VTTASLGTSNPSSSLTRLFTGHSAVALLVYDTLLTLPQEIEQVWSRKLRAIALLYFVGRYVTIGILVWELLDIPIITVLI
jgi:Family of unknown function (DUF6533)